MDSKISLKRVARMILVLTTLMGGTASAYAEDVGLATAKLSKNGLVGVADLFDQFAEGRSRGLSDKAILIKAGAGLYGAILGASICRGLGLAKLACGAAVGYGTAKVADMAMTSGLLGGIADRRRAEVAAFKQALTEPLTACLTQGDSEACATAREIATQIAAVNTSACLRALRLLDRTPAFGECAAQLPESVVPELAAPQPEESP